MTAKVNLVSCFLVGDVAQPMPRSVAFCGVVLVPKVAEFTTPPNGSYMVTLLVGRPLAPTVMAVSPWKLGMDLC